MCTRSRIFSIYSFQQGTYSVPGSAMGLGDTGMTEIQKCLEMLMRDQEAHLLSRPAGTMTWNSEECCRLVEGRVRKRHVGRTARDRREQLPPFSGPVFQPHTAI